MKRKKLIKNIIGIIFLLLSIISEAAPLYTSIIDGNWTTGSTWDIGIPTNDLTTTGDSIIINSYVTLTNILNVKTGTVIIIKSGDTLKIDGDAVFNNGSIIIVEIGAVLWITGNVQNNNSSNTITINGIILIDGNFNGGTDSEIGGNGSMEITGEVSTSGSGSVFGSTDDCNTGDCSSSADAPLPISLISFDAYIDNNVVKLQWVTSTEINNNYFTIEKSKDNIKWEKVSNIDGANNSNQLIKYYNTDYSPYKGLSYYRLKQTDFDGKYSYSKSIFIQVKIKKEHLILFPNPVIKGEILNLEINLKDNDIIIVVLKDIYGKKYYTKILNFDKGKDTILINKNIPTGLYLIIISFDNQFYSKKLNIK